MKKCPFCAEEIQDEAIKCKHCDSIVPNSNNGGPEQITSLNGKVEYSKIIPVWKFILLSLITFGIYELFWFYKHWNLLKKERGLNVSPFWRAFFAPLFAGSIAGHLQNYLKEKNIECNYSVTVIGISYFILSILWKLPNPYWLISMFTFIPMLPLVNSMNLYWEGKNLPLKKFTWWQIILVIIGILLFFLSIIGTFIPE